MIKSLERIEISIFYQILGVSEVAFVL